jgi:predicted RNA-binding protein with PIN domain
VIYSQRGEQADDVIRRMAPQVAHQGVVVTSDRTLARHVERVGAEVIGSAEFGERLRTVLSHSGREKTCEGTEVDPSASEPQRKGAARRASRAERRRERKLRNL